MQSINLSSMCRVCVLASAVGCLFLGCNGGLAEPDAQSEIVESIGTLEHAITYGGHDYLFVTTPKTWEEAQARCKLRGYELVTIDNASEEAFLDGQEAALGLVNWWIGYNDRGIEGTWMWANGSSTHTNWYPGEPNDYLGEDCAVDRYAYGNGFSNSQWNDFNCGDLNPFVCERDGGVTVSNGSFVYSATNTSSATVATTDRSVYLYANQLFTVGTCGLANAVSNGDTWLRVNKPSGQEIASNDDAGGSCGVASSISFVVPMTGSYVVRAGCFSGSSCGGTVAYQY